MGIYVGHPSSSRPLVSHKFWKFIWSKKIPPRVSIWLWKACRDRLPTRLNLYRHRCKVEIQCRFCSQCEESLLHLIQECPIMNSFRYRLLPKLPMSTGMHSVTEFWLSNWRQFSGVEFQILVFFFWTLWDWRNRIIF